MNVQSLVMARAESDFKAEIEREREEEEEARLIAPIRATDRRTQRSSIWGKVERFGEYQFL